jgi:hypothetical protein
MQDSGYHEAQYPNPGNQDRSFASRLASRSLQPNQGDKGAFPSVQMNSNEGFGSMTNDMFSWAKPDVLRDQAAHGVVDSRQFDSNNNSMAKTAASRPRPQKRPSNQISSNNSPAPYSSPTPYPRGPGQNSQMYAQRDYTSDQNQPLRSTAPVSNATPKPAASSFTDQERQKDVDVEVSEHTVVLQVTSYI